MTTKKEKMEFQEKLKTMPKKHPFEYAELCSAYCYDDKPTYVTNPALNAYTYPVYDKDSQSFLYNHYDLETNTMNSISVDLTDLFESSMEEDDFISAIEICNMFNVPMSDMKACQEEVIKMSRCDM